MDDDWLSVQEAADHCGMAYRTLLAMVRRGELAAEKPDGRPYRRRRSDVRRLHGAVTGPAPGQLASAPPRIPPRPKADS